MNRFADALSHAHTHFFADFDAQVGIEAQDPQPLIKRLMHMRVMVFFQGGLGKALLAQWLNLPLQELFILPVTPRDGQALKKLHPHMRPKAQRMTVKFEPSDYYDLDRLLDARHLCIVATHRPFPTLTTMLNEALFRTTTRGFFAQLLGTKLLLGPTVMPGKTACYACYTRQLLANSPHPHADLAIEHYFNTDDTVGFMGQHPSITLMATGYIVAEVMRLLTGHLPPQTIGKEVMTNLLVETPLQHSLITPVNGCPVCHAHPIAMPPRPTLADLMMNDGEVQDAKR